MNRQLIWILSFRSLFILSLTSMSWFVAPSLAQARPGLGETAVSPEPIRYSSVWKPELEEYLLELMREYRLPNLSVQLIDKKGALWQITLGHRDVKQKLPATPNTLYAIGSTTKAFTGLLLMQLHEQGMLTIDDPIKKYRPDFRVSNRRYSSKITLRDLMTHSTGVARHDLAWYHRPDLTREQLFSKIPFLEMVGPPRTEFIYNNWMWLTAGLVAEKVTGQNWEQLVRSRFFIPLRMSSTVTSVADVRRSGDYSLPYEVGSLGVSEVPFYDIAAMNPAGGIYSNLNDMAQWVRLHLNYGQLNGTWLLSPSGMRESHRGTAPMGGGAHYALGWGVIDFAGGKLLTHDGGIDGFASNVSMMPEQGLGVVVLMNAAAVSPQAIALRVWQHVMNEPLTDFVRESKKAAQEQYEKSLALYPDEPQIALMGSIVDYVGSFCHPAYPAVQVYKGARPDELLVTLSVLRSTLYPIGNDQFSIRGQYNDGKVVEFERDSLGDVSVLNWKIEQSLKKPIQFKRCI